MLQILSTFSSKVGSSSSTLFLINVVLVSLPIFSTEVTKELCQCSFPKCSCLNQSVQTAESVAEKYCSTQVNDLDVSFNNITEINTNGGFTVGSCDGLTKLRLRSNSIKHLRSKDFFGLPNIQLLDIGNNNFSFYGDNAFSNVSLNLNTLILDHNPVRIITRKDFFQLNALKYLNLASNRIGYVEDSSFKNCCTQLETLILTENYLTDLDVEMFAGLRQLKVLDLSFNPIRKIPNGSFEDLVNLRNLTITYRKQINLTSITELQSDVFKPLMNLQMLIIQDMRIFTLHGGIFAGLSTHLNHVNLSFNHILNFSTDTFNNLAALETLSLRGNRLSCVPNEAFQHQTRLVSLDLSLNQITYFHYKAFAGLRRLKVLDIHGNPVRQVHMGLACPMTSLETVVIDTSIHQFTFDSEKTLLSLFSSNTSIRIVADSNYFLGKATTLRGERVSCATLNAATTTAMDKSWNISDLAICPFFISYEASYETQGGSRIYLLIIIAICISFLLLAFIVILSYRAWSKRKMLYEEVQTVEMQSLEPDAVNLNQAIKEEDKEEVTKVMINGTPTQSSPIPNDILVRTSSQPNGDKGAETSTRASNGLTTGQLVPARSSTDDDSDTIIALGVV